MPELTLNLIYIPFEDGLASTIEDIVTFLRPDAPNHGIEEFLDVATNYSESVSKLSSISNSKCIIINKVSKDPLDEILEDLSKQNIDLILSSPITRR